MVTRTLFLSNIHSKRIFTRALTGIRAGISEFQMLAAANSHSFEPFGLVLREKLALILMPRLIKRRSLLILFGELLKYDWVVNPCALQIKWRLPGDWFDVAPSGESPTLHP